MTTLFLRLTQAAQASEASEDGHFLRTQWIIAEPDGHTRSSGIADLRGLSELVDPSAEWLKNPANLVVLIPAHLVTNVNCDVPGRNPNQIRRALPFVVEEFIASDIESMHVAAGRINTATQVRALVVQRELIDSWLAALAQVGLRPGYMLPDAEVLANSPTQTTVLLDGEEALLRSSNNVASVDLDNLEFVLPQFLDETSEALELTVVNGALNPLLAAQLPQQCRVNNIDLQDADNEDGLLGFLAQQWLQSAGSAGERINLLQGEYEARLESSASSGRVGTLLKFAAVWFVIALGAQLIKGAYADYKADQIRNEVTTLYKDIYPQEQRIPTDIKRQMQAYMGQKSAEGSQFNSLVGLLSSELAGEARLRGFNFQSSRNELSVELILPGFEPLNALKERLSKNGVTVDISSADNQDDGVHARLRMRAQSDQ